MFIIKKNNIPKGKKKKKKTPLMIVSSKEVSNIFVYFLPERLFYTYLYVVMIRFYIQFCILPMVPHVTYCKHSIPAGGAHHHLFIHPTAGH